MAPFNAWPGARSLRSYIRFARLGLSIVASQLIVPSLAEAQEISVEPGAFGTLFVVTQTDAGPQHRRPLLPGHWDNAEWIATDLVAEPDVVRSAAQSLWTADTVAAYREAFPWVPPVAVLAPLQPWQFYAVLDLSGRRAALDAYIDGLPSPQNVIARAKLDHAVSFNRDNDLVLGAQQALGLSDAALDALWAQALALN